jgi:sulfur-carrier protein
MIIEYFAWVRERIGKSEEVLEPPAAILTVAELIGWLFARGEEYAHAFESPSLIRAAIDHTHVRHRDAMGLARLGAAQHRRLEWVTPTVTLLTAAMTVDASAGTVKRHLHARSFIVHRAGNALAYVGEPASQRKYGSDRCGTTTVRSRRCGAGGRELEV